MREPASFSARGRSPQAGQSRRSCLVIAPLVIGSLLLLLAVGLILFLGLRQMLGREEASPGMGLEVVKLTPTVVPTVTIPPVPPPPPQQLCETIISSGDVQVAASLPISFAVGDRSFPVVATGPEGEGWAHPTGYPGMASWLCGTVVNYVVGLEPTPENETLLVSLRPGDELRLYLSNDVELIFRFAERRETLANEPQVLEQTRPRLTLILERGESVWQVATADYVSEIEPVQPATGPLASPGQPVRVGDAQITVLGGRVERSGSGLQSGTMYYLVEFSVENVGEAVLDSAAFNMRLDDGVGNSYLLSSEASAVGENGPLSGEVGPGTVAQGTAGYLVPEALVGPALIWTFAPQAGSISQASVSIPYEPDVGPSSPAQAEVTIDEDSTFLSSGGDVLIVAGQVRNVGGEPLVVELDDISLTSSAGMSGLRAAGPQLPWTIQPGEGQIIELQYNKPDAPTVLLTILGYSFEIRGLW